MPALRNWLPVNAVTEMGTSWIASWRFRAVTITSSSTIDCALAGIADTGPPNSATRARASGVRGAAVHWLLNMGDSRII